jgi:cytochrome c551/c552
MSQEDTLRVRNAFITIIVVGSLVVSLIIVGLLGSRLKWFGNENVVMASEQEAIEMRLAPVGKLAVKSATPVEAAKPAAPATPVAETKPAAAPEKTEASASQPSSGMEASSATKPADASGMAADTAAKPEVSAPPAKEAGDKSASATLTDDDAIALISEKGYACLACHQIGVKVLGPGYKEVANKYKGDASAQESLMKKIKEGSVGTWGETPMPANASVTDEDLKALVTWILSLAK